MDNETESQHVSELEDHIFHDCNKILKNISTKSDECSQIVQNLSRNINSVNISQLSPVHRLKIYLLLKYLCYIVIFIRSKFKGTSTNMDTILKNLCISVMELEHTRYIYNKKRVVDEMIKNKSNNVRVDKIYVEETGPDINSLIPKSGANITDELETFAEQQPSKYRPRKDKFVPYPFGQNSSVTEPKKSAIKRSVLPKIHEVDPMQPEEIKLFEDIEPQKRKHVPQKINSELRYMMDDEELENLADDMLSKGPKKKKFKAKGKKGKLLKKKRK